VPTGSLTLERRRRTRRSPITRSKKLLNGTTRRLYTVEESDVDLDESSQIPDVPLVVGQAHLGTDARSALEFGAWSARHS
jgi:hypothetical protein